MGGTGGQKETRAEENGQPSEHLPLHITLSPADQQAYPNNSPLSELMQEDPEFLAE